MDFEDSKEEAEFRVKVKEWLATNSAKYNLDNYQSISTQEKLSLGREFQACKADSGFAKITWPTELGGRNGTPMQEIIYAQEEEKYNFPTAFFTISLGMPIPIMRRFATKSQQEKYIPPALRGDQIWCQLFSEPAAGSDLSAIRLKAERRGDKWILNGQKIWTSYADISDYGVIITRTDSSVPKHKGMTYFFIDMKSPGVEVRPIIQASGGGEFCEVFFTDVEIPDENRLGEINRGWEVAIATLMEERFTATTKAIGGVPLKEVMRFLSNNLGTGYGSLHDPIVRDKIAEWYCVESGIKNFLSRKITGFSQGQIPGPEGALSKLVFVSKVQAQSSEIMDFTGPASCIFPEGQLTRDNDVRTAWMEMAGFRIAGGTDEILRNTIAERVLGLPGDVRVDKDIPFNEL